MSEDGSVEHFVGDQFVGYWGAPDAQKDAADRAFRAALKVIGSLESLRNQLPPEKAALFGYGLALHSGKAIAGNKGSFQRLDYGLVGDLINSAARVESLTKYYGVRFLMTRPAYQYLNDPPCCRIIDQVVVKGRTTPLEIIEPKHGFSPPNFDSLCARYAQAFKLYQAGDFGSAIKQFTLLVDNDSDNPSRTMAARCQALLEKDIASWSGIYHLESK